MAAWSRMIWPSTLLVRIGGLAATVQGRQDTQADRRWRQSAEPFEAYDLDLADGMIGVKVDFVGGSCAVRRQPGKPSPSFHVRCRKKGALKAPPQVNLVGFCPCFSGPFDVAREMRKEEQQAPSPRRSAMAQALA